MASASAYLLATLMTAIFLGGVVACSTGAATLKESRTGYLGADWHAYERQRARTWFLVAAACWSVDVWIWWLLR